MSNRRRNQQRITVFIGTFLAVIMGLSLLLPLLQSNVAVAPPSVDPTATPRPTLPPPIADFSSISFDETYLHPSGLFTAAQPSGWVPTRETNSTGEALVTLNNAEQLSVVEMRILRPVGEGPYDTTEAIDAIFDDAWLRSSWSSYTRWDESVRTIEDEQHIMDFTLSRANQDFIARQIATTDGTWVYITRVVTPTNASDMLQFVLNSQVETFDPIERFVGERMEWDAAFDAVNQTIIRYPGDWTIADSAPGAPTSISGAWGQLRVETIDEALADADAASAYVEGLRSGTEVLSVVDVEQMGQTGFRVAYQRETLDGTTESGAVTVLQGDEASYVANLLLGDPVAVDLNAEDLDASYAQAVELLSTFSLLPDVELASAN